MINVYKQRHANYNVYVKKQNMTDKVEIHDNIIFVQYNLGSICLSIVFYTSQYFDFIYDDPLTLMKGVTPPPSNE